MSKTTKSALPEGQSRPAETSMHAELIETLESAKASFEERWKTLVENEEALAEKTEKFENLRAYVSKLERTLEPDDASGISELNAGKTKLSLYPKTLKALGEEIEKGQTDIQKECCAFRNGLYSLFAEWDQEFHARAAKHMEFFYPGDPARAAIVVNDTPLFMTIRGERKNCFHETMSPKSNHSACLRFIAQALAQLRGSENTQ